MNASVASLLTPSAPSGISVISLTGAGAERILKHLFKSAHGERRNPPGASRAAYGLLVHQGRTLDEVLVVCREEAHFEICCHGGETPADAILRALRLEGARIEPWSALVGERTLNHDLLYDLLKSKGPMQAAVLAHLYSGSLREAFLSLQEALHSPAAEVRERALALARNLEASWACGRFLHQPPRVVITGAANAGKSTLFNAILGERRVLTSRIPGTTRDPVEAAFLLHGFPVRLFDLPGTDAESDSPLSLMARKEADRRLADADLILHVTCVDLEGRFKPYMEFDKELAVINKADLLEGKVRERMQRRIGATPILSALAEEGLERLFDQMSSMLCFKSLQEEARPLLVNRKQVMFVRSVAKALETGTPAPALERKLRHYLSSPIV